MMCDRDPPWGQHQASGSAAPGAHRAGSTAVFAAVPSLLPSATPRGRGALGARLPPVPSVCIFVIRPRVTAEPSRRRGAPRIPPNFSRDQTHRRAPALPVARRPLAQGRAPLPPQGRFWWERVAVAQGADGDVGARGFLPGGSPVPARFGLPPAPLLALLALPRLCPRILRAGGIGPARESFTSPSASCVLLKANEKLFPLVGFVALPKRRRPRPAEAAGPAARSGVGPFPGPGTPSPAGAGGTEGGMAGISQVKRKAAVYGKKDLAFIENLIYDSVL